MNRLARLAAPLTVMACALAGAGRQRGHPPRPEPVVEPEPSLGPAPHEGAIRDNNLGLVLMNRRQFEEALGKFQRVCILDPESDAGCLNMGIALLNMRQYDQASTILTKSAERDPANARAWFNLGLLERARGRPQAAIEDLKKVAAIDPQDADTQYLAGLIYSEDHRDDQAIAAFETAVNLDPVFPSALLGLAQAEQRTGDTTGALEHLDRFRRLTANNLGEPKGSSYGEQGKYSLAEELFEPEPAPAAIRVQFVDVTSGSGLPFERDATARARDRLNGGHRVRSERPGESAQKARSGPSPNLAMPSLANVLGTGACILDYDGDGRPDIFLVNSDGRGHAALYRNSGGGRFVEATRRANLDFHGEGTGCAVGDYDNDGRPDLALSSAGRVVLYHNEDNRAFKDVTDAAGIHTDGLSLGLTFIGHQHDRNLDLYVTRFNNFPSDHPAQPFTFPYDEAPPGNVLWRNDGQGSFTDGTNETALRGNTSSVGAIGVDLNNDRAVDLVLTGWEKPPSVFLNQRDGTFRPITPWATGMPRHPAGVTALDFDKDGWMDLAFTHWAPPGLSLWRNVRGKSFEPVELPGPEWMRGWGLAALDYDNDGWVDLAAVGENFSGEGRIVLLRNEGDRGFRDVTHETGLDKIKLASPRGLIAFDYDGDGSTDLLITQNNRPPVLLKNIGASKNNWLGLRLQGERDNRVGVGTKIELLAGAQRQKWELPGASGYLGQGPEEILAGLGNKRLADVVRLLWPTGVLQDEVQISGRRRDVIQEAAEPRAAP
ncbi:MAG TPA: FG-GAP-like repeat-containing protein [Verrucomicrobiae bacterium]|jgi:tetratricopeptide (TPR) repeat protein|nr:FG-GAP-like repeat-containing protein [Verrucomicrobiae bacterium]